MIIALDKDNNRIHIDESIRKNDYYCPSCGKPLVIRKGEIRRHHFAHMPNSECTDSWASTYDMSSWHIDWQSKYPKSNQEILCTLGSINHRADVMIDRTVVEFQHSSMSTETFNNRNSFYDGLGYKVIWLFDLRDEYENHSLTRYKSGNEYRYSWPRPKKTFNQYDDIQYGTVDLFFQLTDTVIIRINDIDPVKGFENFTTQNDYSVDDFLKYTGLINGKCLPPDQSDVHNNEQYMAFKNRFGIELNPQQERAVQAVNGSNLILAVPGSGKTTVLVSHIGYMIYCKNIPPENILAVSYNRKAAEEMKIRFIQKFGDEFKNRLEIRTINSLSLDIINYYYENESKKDKPLFPVIDDRAKRELFYDIYRKTHKEHPLDSDIKEIEIAFTFIKNFMLTDDEIKKCSFPIEKTPEMFRLYQDELRERLKKMDFDDQMVYAKKILETYPRVLSYYRTKFKYICVDEAQDTSKLQHALIKMLANGNNIFMVGDEDQSIYAFRAAYPQALLDFKNDYPNPHVFRMENNYRSTEDIVNKAGLFISRSRRRYKKKILCTRGPGRQVERIDFENRSEQFKYLLDIAKQLDTDTAILYRNNESMIPLVDLLIRNNVPYRTKAKDEKLFFSNKIVQDIKAFIDLAYDPYNTDAFEKIVFKVKKYFNSNDKKWAVNNCKWNKMTVLEGLVKQKETYGKKDAREIDRARSFKLLFETLPKLNAFQALQRIDTFGYGDYLSDKNLDRGKLETLYELAKSVSDLKELKHRLDELPDLIEKNNTNRQDAIYLSTIHSSKGLEYKRVYILDAYEGSLPQVTYTEAQRDNSLMEKYQEERRLFYVAMTRAKDELYLLAPNDKRTPFIDELVAPKRIIEKTAVTTNQFKPNISSAKMFEYLAPKESESIKLNSKLEEFKPGKRVKHNPRGTGVVTDIKKNPTRNAHNIYITFDNGTSGSFELEILIKNSTIEII
ncbi:MAG: UvrD-helicase domain-containing protein [Ruminococcus sp.]|nr:UvrD-helicase domain-containing protein [Ruminococcus sp.]